MWAPALFVQDDTLHIHSSLSRQTSTDLGSLCVSVWEKMRESQVSLRSDGMYSVV